jgi:pantoate--beta-alanine ligase
LIVVRTIDDMRSWVRSIRIQGRSIGFVPTMGALHDGHLQLAKRSIELSDATVVSIFVNPTQFGPNEDLNKYPRPIDDDLEKCRTTGVSAVFHPSAQEMYGNGSYIGFKLDKMGDHLCGASRPGHFSGVIQVVNKLFNIVQPDIAVFGQKDYQQYRILERMVEEFNHPLKMVMHPTVRANDGLALSSRNRYLSDKERLVAPLIYSELQQIATHLRDNPSVKSATSASRERLMAAGFKIDYISVVSNNDLQPLVTANGTCVVAIAVYLGTTRLIDNLLVELH